MSVIAKASTIPRVPSVFTRFIRKYVESFAGFVRRAIFICLSGYKNTLAR